MIYLQEHEIGCDASEIGFPSISGCRAIVLVTAGGLFGYHLYGFLYRDRLNKFVHFVNHHQLGAGSKKTLYLASTVPVSTPEADTIYGEARFIASSLSYFGTMYYAKCHNYDPADVHFQDLNHTTCIISARQWDRGGDGNDANKALYQEGANRELAYKPLTKKMFIHQDPGQLKVTYPTQIPPGKPPKPDEHGRVFH
jgi:hypothetical protein